MGVMRSIGGGVKWTLKPFFEVSKWFAAEEVAHQAKRIRDQAVDVGGLKKSERSETFAEAMARLDLTEADILIKQRAFLRLTLVFLAMSAVALIYAIYLFWEGGVWSGAIAFVLGLVGLGYAFRYHFWFFQVKQRRLGCTVREWLQGQAGESDS